MLPRDFASDQWCDEVSVGFSELKRIAGTYIQFYSGVLAHCVRNKTRQGLFQAGVPVP